MKLHFSAARVRKLVEHCKASTEHATLYDNVTGPGLWLVGDQGVYLLSNGRPALMADGMPKREDDDETKQFVCYAEGINPEKDDFNDWWARKRESFGGDDGVEFLSLKDVEACLDAEARWLMLEVTPSSVGFYAPIPKRRKPPALDDLHAP